MKKSLKVVPFLIVLAAVGCERSGRAPKVAAADEKKNPPTVTNLNPTTPAKPVPTALRASLPITPFTAAEVTKGAQTGEGGSIHCESLDSETWQKLSLDIEVNQGDVAMKDDRGADLKTTVATVHSSDLNNNQDFRLLTTIIPIYDKYDGTGPAKDAKRLATQMIFSSDLIGRTTGLATHIDLNFGKDGSILNIENPAPNEIAVNHLVIGSAGETETLTLKCESKLTNPPTIDEENTAN